MKNQILDPMTCELQIGDLCEVLESSLNVKAGEIATLIEIDSSSPEYLLKTCGRAGWRTRHQIRLVERNGQPINQPEKTMKKTSEKIAAFAANVASLTEALDEAADMVECLEAQIAGAEALREINKKLGERVDDLEAKNQKQSEYLAECHRVLAFNRERNQIHGYVRLLLYASEVAGKLQVSEAVVWDMFFSVCKRAVFTIPEAPEPVEPPVVDDFKECRGGFDCNLNPIHSK